MTPELFAPYVQYGFAGFAFLMFISGIGFFYWAIRQLIKLIKYIGGVVERNTEVIARHDGVANMRYEAQMKVLERIDDSLDEHRDMVEDRRDKPVQGFAEDVAEVTAEIEKPICFGMGYRELETHDPIITSVSTSVPWIRAGERAMAELARKEREKPNA